MMYANNNPLIKKQYFFTKYRIQELSWVIVVKVKSSYNIYH